MLWLCQQEIQIGKSFIRKQDLYCQTRKCTNLSTLRTTRKRLLIYPRIFFANLSKVESETVWILGRNLEWEVFTRQTKRRLLFVNAYGFIIKSMCLCLYYNNYLFCWWMKKRIIEGRTARETTNDQLIIVETRKTLHLQYLWKKLWANVKINAISSLYIYFKVSFGEGCKLERSESKTVQYNTEELHVWSKILCC